MPLRSSFITKLHSLTKTSIRNYIWLCFMLLIDFSYFFWLRINNFKLLSILLSFLTLHYLFLLTTLLTQLMLCLLLFKNIFLRYLRVILTLKMLYIVTTLQIFISVRFLLWMKLNIVCIRILFMAWSVFGWLLESFVFWIDIVIVVCFWEGLFE